jgi:outer membrane protein assembly factor BamB
VRFEMSRAGRGLRSGSGVRGWVARSLLMLLAIALVGQVQIQRPGVIGLQRGRNKVEPLGIVIETSPELANLMSTAKEAVERADWKLAIDSLQRIVDDSAGSLVEIDEDGASGVALYESARWYATRKLASFPAAGLRAYRTLFDGQARGVYDRSRKAGDRAGVRRVAEHYLLTSSGDDAAELLASWALDEGRPSEAIVWLTAVQSVVPDSDVPRLRLYAKLAAAFSMLGRNADAAEALRSYGGDGLSEAELPTWFAQLGAAEDDEPGTVTDDMLRPTLLASTPWNHALPGTTTNFWRRLRDEDTGDRPLLVEKQFAIAGDKIFVRRPGGCRALLSDDLSTLWDVKTGIAEVDSEGSVVSARQWLPMKWLRFAATAEVDPAANLVGAASGLVFVVESSGEGVYRDIDEVSPEVVAEQAAIVGPAGPVVRASGTRLVALDAVTGEVRWARGRTAHAQDLLGSVRFRSTPIAVVDQLWVPYYNRADFFVAVLRATDGALLANVLLGSVNDARRTGNLLAPMRYGDGVVYIPSGVGVLFAVDARDHTLRWASRYKSTDDGDVDGTSSGWISQAPVILGDTVVIAPSDSTALTALSAVTGSFRWSSVVDGASYIIDAAGERIWVGGRKVAAIGVGDGEVLWETELATVATGQGVRTGGMLNLPVADGLLVIDAATGAEVEKFELPEAMFPLGHIERIGPSLVSFDPSSVRRYPDLDKVFEVASRAVARNNRDVRASAQLAWATLLRGDAKGADAIASATESWVSDADDGGDYARSLSRVRLEALFALADASGSADGDILARLDEVCDATLSQRDQLRCRVKMSELYASSGDYVKSHRSLFDFGLSAAAEDSLSGDGLVRLSMRRDLASHLHAIRKKMRPKDLSTIESAALMRVDALVGKLRGDGGIELVRELQRFVDLWDDGLVGQRCLLGLADDAVARRKYERGEQYLGEVMHMSGGVQESISARLRLCSLYGESIEDVPELLVPCLSELDRQYGSMPVPAEFYRGRGTDASSRELVGEWVRKMRSLIPTSVLEVYGTGGDRFSSDSGSQLHLTGERAWSHNMQSGTQPRIVRMRPAGGPANGDRVVLFSGEAELECIDAARGGVLWKAELTLPRKAFEVQRRARRSYVESNPRFAVIDGQTLVVNAGDAIFGVGMITGRRLWARRYDVRLGAQIAPYRDGAMAGGDGYVAALPRDGYLSLLRARDGSTVWERDLRGEAVRRVWMAGDRIVTADAAMARAHVFDRADGRLVRRAIFDQPNPGTEVVSLVTTGGVLCGPAADGASAGVVGIDLRSGKDLWRIELSKPVGHVFEVAPGHLGIGMLGGEMKVIDVATGEVLLEYEVPQGRATMAGAYFEGSIILAVETLRGSPRVPTLIALDIATGEQLWFRDDIVAVPGISEGLPIMGGVLPAFVQFQETKIVKGKRAQRRSQTSLAFLDPRTGTTLGEKVPLRGALSNNRVEVDLAIHGEFAILGTSRDMRAFRIERNRGGGDGGL